MTDRAPSEVLTVKQFREALGGIGNELAYKLINSGQIRSIKVGAKRLIPRSAFDAFLAGESGSTTEENPCTEGDT